MQRAAPEDFLGTIFMVVGICFTDSRLGVSLLDVCSRYPAIISCSNKFRAQFWNPFPVSVFTVTPFFTPFYKKNPFKAKTMYIGPVGNPIYEPAIQDFQNKLITAMVKEGDLSEIVPGMLHSDQSLDQNTHRSVHPEASEGSWAPMRAKRPPEPNQWARGHH